MSKVSVQKVADEKSLPAPWMEELQKLSKKIRSTAFELFERSGRANGHDLEHWLEAEKALSLSDTELREDPTEFEVRIPVLGFDAKEVELTALPDALLVRAQASHEREDRDGGLRSAEFTDQWLFRCIPLPEPITVAGVTAKIDKGILKIVAPKAPAQKEKRTNTSVAA